MTEVSLKNVLTDIEVRNKTHIQKKRVPLKNSGIYIERKSLIKYITIREFF